MSIESVLGALAAHPWLFTVGATALAAGGAVVAHRNRDNLDVVKNIHVLLVPLQGGKWAFQMRSGNPQRVYLSQLYPSDPILRWRLRRDAKAGRPLAAEHGNIDYIPLGERVVRLRSELQGSVDLTAAENWYDVACRIEASIADPIAVLFVEQYPDADMCWRQVILHPRTLAKLAALKPMISGTSGRVENIEVEKDNHYELLRRLADIAHILLVDDSESGSSDRRCAVRERIDMRVIGSPKTVLRASCA